MIKFFLALLFTFLFFSCASSPKENEESVLHSETEITAEENQLQEQEIEKTQEQNPEISNEEIHPEKNSSDENPPEEKIQEEIKLEPIEDIQGYYESDPEPVFLEKQEVIEPIEETEEIPLVPPEEKKTGCFYFSKANSFFSCGRFFSAKRRFSNGRLLFFKRAKCNLEQR